MTIWAISVLACVFPLSSLPPHGWATVQGPLRTAAVKRKEILLITKPRFRDGYYVDREPGPRPHGGSVRDQRHETWLEFEYEGKLYSELWAAMGWRNRVTPAPVALEKNTTYKFLLRLEENSSRGRCSVLKIWLGERLLWSRPAGNQTRE